MIGAVTAEKEVDGGINVAWLDKLPYGSEFHINFATVSQHSITQDINKKEKAARRSPDADQTLREAEHFKDQFNYKKLFVSYSSRVFCRSYFTR